MKRGSGCCAVDIYRTAALTSFSNSIKLHNIFIFGMAYSFYFQNALDINTGTNGHIDMCGSSANFDACCSMLWVRPGVHLIMCTLQIVNVGNKRFIHCLLV